MKELKRLPTAEELRSMGATIVVDAQKIREGRMEYSEAEAVRLLLKTGTALLHGADRIDILETEKEDIKTVDDLGTLGYMTGYHDARIKFTPYIDLGELLIKSMSFGASTNGTPKLILEPSEEDREKIVRILTKLANEL